MEERKLRRISSDISVLKKALEGLNEILSKDEEQISAARELVQVFYKRAEITRRLILETKEELKNLEETFRLNKSIVIKKRVK